MENGEQNAGQDVRRNGMERKTFQEGSVHSAGDVMEKISFLILFF